MPTVFAYIVDRHESGPGLEAQQDRLLAHFELMQQSPDQRAQPLTWGGFFVEAASDVKLPFINRREGSGLCGRLKPGDHVLFVHLNRSFRDWADLIGTLSVWDKRQVRLCFVDQMLDGSATDFLRAALYYGEWKSAARSESIRDGLAKNREGQRAMNRMIAWLRDGSG
jgi:hypothetical protein